MKQPSAKLLAEWNRKLADSGFHDIENAAGTLETNRGAMHEEMAATAEERAQYFRLARDFTLTRRFKALPPRDQRIWSMHADGATQREIAAALGHASPHRVTDVIVRLRGEMTVGRKGPVAAQRSYRDARPPLGGTTWTRRAAERMDDRMLYALLPALTSALARRIGRGSSKRSTP